MNKQKVVIVTGATGELGKAYVDYYSKSLNTICYALSRKEELKKIQGVKYLCADLLDVSTVRNRIDEVSLENVIDVTLIHPVGMFKFENEGTAASDKNNDGVDDEIFASNVMTFYNILNPMLEKTVKCKNIPLKLVAFGSLSDSSNVPWWSSYSKSKQILRNEIKSITRKVSSIKALFVNLSSVKTANESKTRPLADTKYWITPKEVVDITAHQIDGLTSQYTEIDVFHESPEFYNGYYGNYDALKVKWLREMGIKA